MIDSKKKQIRNKKCSFNRVSPRALEKAGEAKKTLYGKGLSWKERYERNKKAIKEFEKWWK